MKMNIRMISVALMFLLTTACGGKSGDKASGAPTAADPMAAQMATVPEMAADPMVPEMAADPMAPEMAAEPMAPEMAADPVAAGSGIPEEKLPAVETIVFPKPKMYKSIELDRLQAKAVYLKLHAAVEEAAQKKEKLALRPLLEAVSIAPKGACTFGMRAELVDPVPLIKGMPVMHEKLGYGFIVHFLKGEAGDCSAENFCAISVAPAAGDKYQIVAEPLQLNLGPGPVKLQSVVSFTPPNWFVFLEGITFESAGTGYCTAADAAAAGGTGVTKRRAALLALVQGRFRTTFNGYIGEDSDSETEGKRKNEYRTAVSLYEDKSDPTKNFHYYRQERKWFFTKFEEEKDARSTVTKEELECKLINAEGALVFLPRDRQALLEGMDPKFKNCNVAGQYVQKWGD
ncbi:MAG: hypothetical protein CVU65_01990 [Deltaproteobacteria bacterium HGW-Deltaproteobacteria-22]|jgi:hypothetical protein|nr:MAG: hypothetical protein CVU65_01990 [Deltaproteobacteria bacterium HGW-Deltaproteobacteria-22]